ncbi:ankyrin repeat domain-containing protein 63 [Gadus chalcogrammus]|uniref:ankyrin repeat domain-containing protein 63 n=1 Tax=Gadus chalcogrammus TaxID=1042646 RepID=UPI0024C386B6|nr:ankyrin repeat domain-containing protein 63 [Gadus chalcogrammus]
MMRPKDLRQGSGTKTFLDAMHGGKVHLARFILDALDGRIINSKTESGRTPLMFAVRLQEPGARAKFARLLLEKGAEVNLQDEDGRTGLSHACELGHLEAVKLLVQFNADPDVADAWGNNALMYAAFSGHAAVLEFLVRAFKRLGFKLDRTNCAGHSALQVAGFFGHNQCVQILSFPCRSRAAGAEDPPADTGCSSVSPGEGHPPSRLPRHILERFSKQLGNTEQQRQLPGVFHRQLRAADAMGLWNRFSCPAGQPPEDSHQRLQHPAPPQPDNSVLSTAKQLHNCQLRDLRGATTVNSAPTPSQTDVKRGPLRGTLEAFPLWGKAKSFNSDLLSGRKQSYQGEVRDGSLSASRLKRASLQDERSLLDKTECQGHRRSLAADGDKTNTLVKAQLSGKTPADQLTGGSLKERACDQLASCPGWRGEQQLKRGSIPAIGSRNKLLFIRGETGDPRKASEHGHAAGLTGLGTRLLRRFTAPDFMRMVIDCSSANSSSASSTHSRGRISRSETFPLSHQQVNSQPSVDSISGVRCEFDSSSCSQATLG